MPAHRLSADQLQETVDLVFRWGSVTEAAKAIGVPRVTLQSRYDRARSARLMPKVEAKEAPPRITRAPEPIPDDVPPRRHLVIPDTQVRPGVPTDHLDWIGQEIVQRRPDVVSHMGDHWDFASLNSHVPPGAAPLEGARFQDDIEAGNRAFAQVSKPMEDEIDRRANKANKLEPWDPEKEFYEGNHEDRANKVAIADPKWMGTVGSHHCQVRGWRWNPFLQRREVDGIFFSHYFQNSHSKYPIGGNVDSRLNKIGASFIQGHEQGKRRGERITAAGATWYGLVIGSCYLHVEDYRGRQGQRHWRGIIVLNEVQGGEYDIMEVSLGYLCRKYEGMRLVDFMNKKYAGGDWNHLL